MITKETARELQKASASARRLKKFRDTELKPGVELEDGSAMTTPEKLTILTRRMHDPYLRNAVQIELKEPGWELRWINTQVQNRFFRATGDQGWTVVKAEELKVAPELIGLPKSSDGIVRRGDKGQEILVKMPASVFRAIRKRKGEIALAQFKKDTTTSALAEDAAGAFGPQAGDAVAKFKGSVTTTRGPLTDEVAAPEI